MIEIDGSIGEGGGQVLRTALALSVCLNKPVRIYNIRAKRKPPGLRPQHLTAVKALADLSRAEVRGLKVGSCEVLFRPKGKYSGSYYFDIGTAGSISLVLQAILPATSFFPRPLEISIRGGTDVSKSPLIDYVRFVFLPILRKMGYEIEIEIKQRGHYPRGGGLVTTRIHPVRDLKSLTLTSQGAIRKIEGISHCVRLPAHVAERQAKAAEEYLKSSGYTEIEVKREWYPPERDKHLGPGSGIVLYALTSTGAIIGSDALGEKGKPAEVVGREAATKLVDQIKSNMPVDMHLADMLIPFLAIAKGASKISVAKITSHLLTNIRVTEEITSVRFLVDGKLGSRGTISTKS